MTANPTVRSWPILLKNSEQRTWHRKSAHQSDAKSIFAGKIEKRSALRATSLRRAEFFNRIGRRVPHGWLNFSRAG